MMAMAGSRAKPSMRTEQARALAEIAHLDPWERVEAGLALIEEARTFQAALSEMRGEALREMREQGGLTWAQVGELVGMRPMAAMNLAMRSEWRRRATISEGGGGQ